MLRLNVISLSHLRACFKRYIGTELIFSLALLIVFMVWARAGSVVSIFLPANSNSELTEMIVYVTVLLLVSLLFLSITFAASVFSLPMIMHRDVDAITATVTSINAVLRNAPVMLMWGFMIAILILVGILTGGIGLIFFMPLIGHAVWHGYLDTIDSDAFPRHQLGITATKRLNK